MVVGITGSIASGKSLVTTYLINKGYKVIDSDKISHEVLFINEVKQRLINQFGSTIITNNEINRKELGFIVFNDNNKKEQLQNIVFPYILEEIKKQISNNKGLIFLDAPLLIEYNIMYLVDKIIELSKNFNKGFTNFFIAGRKKEMYSKYHLVGTNVGKVIDFTADNINPVIVGTSLIKVAGSDDKLDTSAREATRLTCMFGAEALAKEVIGMPVSKKINGKNIMCNRKNIFEKK